MLEASTGLDSVNQIPADSKATQTLPKAQLLFVFLQQRYLDRWKHWHLPFSSLHPFLLKSVVCLFPAHYLAELLQPLTNLKALWERRKATLTQCLEFRNHRA